MPKFPQVSRLRFNFPTISLRLQHDVCSRVCEEWRPEAPFRLERKRFPSSISHFPHLGLLIVDRYLLDHRAPPISAPHLSLYMTAWPQIINKTT